MTPAGTSNELDVQNKWEEKHTRVCQRTTAVKSSSGLILVIYREHVNSAGVAVGTERNQAIQYLTFAFIHSALEVLKFVRRPCQTLHVVPALVHVSQVAPLVAAQDCSKV